MKTVSIMFPSINSVKSFANDITKYDFDFDVVSGRYIQLNIHADGLALEEVLPALKPYLAKENSV